MKNLKIYSFLNKYKRVIISRGVSGILLTATLLSGGCKKNDSNIDDIENTIYVTFDNTKKGINDMNLNLNDDFISNASIIILLDELFPIDQNGKVNIEYISNLKSRIDKEKMMIDFNSFLNILEQNMIEKEELISISHLCDNDDAQALSIIEEITSNIITAKKEANQEKLLLNYNLMYELFVLENSISYNNFTFKIRDLSYSSRAIATAYARTSNVFSNDYITVEQKNAMDLYTNNQNSKYAIYNLLSRAQEKLIEQPKMKDDTFETKDKFMEGKLTLARNSIKIDIPDENLDDLVYLINLGYLESSNVSLIDENILLGAYDDNKVNNILFSIDTILNNNNEKEKVLRLSNLLVDSYKESDRGTIDKLALDYVQNNIKRLNEEINDLTTYNELKLIPYYQNLFNYITKQNFVHRINNEEFVIEYQQISEGINLINNEMIYQTLNKLSNINEISSVIEKSKQNLEESVQYYVITYTGECQKVKIK